MSSSARIAIQQMLHYFFFEEQVGQCRNIRFYLIVNLYCNFSEVIRPTCVHSSDCYKLASNKYICVKS